MPKLLPRSGLASADYAIAKLDADLNKIRKETEKELSKKLKEVGTIARDAVRSSEEDPYATGTLRKSFKVSVRKKYLVSLYSNLPQAPVWEWGGGISPHGHEIEIPRTEFVTKTVREKGDEIDEEIADALDSVAHRNGFFF